MKKIGDIFGIPVFTSKSVERGKAFLLNNPKDYIKKKEDKYYVIHPKDKDKFYGIVIKHLNNL